MSPRIKTSYAIAILFLTIFFALSPRAHPVKASGNTLIFLTSGSSWTVPADWNSSNNSVEVIGGGGGGAGGQSNFAGDGGAGGAYSIKGHVVLTPGASVSYHIGAGGTAGGPQNGGQAGGGTYFCNSTSNCSSMSDSGVVVSANGGSGGPQGEISAAGGSTSGALGDTKYAGGAGGATNNNNGGAGGGGAAGQYGSGATSNVPTSGGGGTGGGGGSGGGNGQTNSSGTGGAGGNGYLGSGVGGAGGATFVGNGNAGGNGADWDSTHGSGGGGGGGGSTNTVGGAGGLYGAGGGGGGYNSTAGSNGGAGAQGIIVISYAPNGASDTAAPSVPTNVSGTGISSSQINLSWTASYDNVGVTGYKIFRNGVNVGTSNTNSYSDTGLSAYTQYTYTISAYDAATNESSQSMGANATTLPAANTFSITLEKSYEGSGSIAATGASLNCNTSCSHISALNISGGTQITLTASPAAGSVFLNWGGACSGTSNTCSLTVSTSTAVTALFQTQAAMNGPTANNIAEPGEACDGADLAGMTPLLIPGYSGGTLRCKADRSGFDVSGLTPGKTINAASCSQTDVQTALTSARDGDTVVVPAGSCSWSGGVSFGTYSVVLKGAGTGHTNITYNMATAVWPNFFAINAVVPAGRAVRITGFTFNGANNKTPATGAVNISGFARVDDSEFLNLFEYGMQIYSGNGGLVDHNLFIKSLTAGPVTEVALGGDIVERTGNPLDSWARPPSLGTRDAIYLENNTFDLSNVANGPEDAYEGARFVMRDNQLYGSHLGWHGYDSSLRGIFQYEIYDNHMVNSGINGDISPNYPHDTLFESRSGSGVIFNNTITNGPGANQSYGTYDGFIQFRNYRSDDGYLTNNGAVFPWDGVHPFNGVCDGTNSNDGNDPGMLGYPCKDQTGRTTNQALMPTYLWNNNFLGTIGGGVTIGGYAPPPPGGTERIAEHIVANRDFYNNTAKPGYTPYVYPHPLVQLDTSNGSPAPTPTPPSTPSGGGGGGSSPPITSPSGGAAGGGGTGTSTPQVSTSTPSVTPTPVIISSGTTTVWTFTKNLSLGMHDAQVITLQKYLNQNGYPIIASGPGSLGKETNYFGPATQRALIKFQKAKGIIPPSGYFGPLTRTFVTGIKVIAPTITTPAPVKTTPIAKPIIKPAPTPKPKVTPKPTPTPFKDLME